MAKNQLPGGTDMDRLKSLSAMKYADQAKFYLNFAWDDGGQDHADDVWQYTEKMVEIDEKNGKEGNELTEFDAHRFLESFEEAMTVMKLRNVLKDIDIDTNRNVSLAEYLIYKKNVDWGKLVNSIQGSKEEMEKAQKLLDEANEALANSQAKAKLAREKEEAALEAERGFKEAQEEVEASLAELTAQQNAYDNKKATLTEKSETGGIVSRNKAKNELQQLLAEDPLPLTRAKISNEAALRKAEKARAPFKATREAAEAVRAEAEEALNEAQAAFKAAEDYLDEVKATSEQQGSAWWMGRELEEAKKYLPQSKGGTAAGINWKP